MPDRLLGFLFFLVVLYVWARLFPWVASWDSRMRRRQRNRAWHIHFQNLRRSNR